MQTGRAVMKELLVEIISKGVSGEPHVSTDIIL
jgi:hypothetical protein